MEEKVKLSNLKNVDSGGSLHRKYQELLKAIKGKDELISQLEAQLEKQVRAHAQGSTMPSSTSVLLTPSFLSWSAQALECWGTRFLLSLFFYVEISL